MIEILTGVYYDPSKGWYEQPTELIILGDEVITSAPVALEMQDVLGGGQRLVSGVWQTTTECGTFNMGVRPVWQYGPMSEGFNSRLSQDIITVTQI